MLSVLCRSTGLFFLILIMRKMLGKVVPRRTWVYLWSLVVLRFLIPCNIRVALWSKENSSYHIKIDGDSKELFSGEILLFLSVIWVIGILFTALKLGIMFYTEIKLLQEAIPYNVDRLDASIPQPSRRKVRFVLSDKVQSPVTYGILKPVIVLSPDSVRKNEMVLSHVLIHEMMHILHFDNLYKMLSMIALAIYWFDPFAWVLFFMLSKDIELACDESVLSYIGEDQKKQYALSLLSIADRNGESFSCSTGFGKKNLIERMEMIMNHRRIKPRKTVAIMALIGVISLVFFVSAKDNSQQFSAVNASDEDLSSEADIIVSDELSSSDSEEDILEDDSSEDTEEYEAPVISDKESVSAEVSGTDSEENLNPWYRKYNPDLTDEEVRQIEAVHEANRQLIADYEAKHKK